MINGAVKSRAENGQTRKSLKIAANEPKACSRARDSPRGVRGFASPENFEKLR